MKGLPVGIQLYGLRDLLVDPPSFKTVLGKIKSMGYDGVEFAGLYGLEPEFIAAALQEMELTPVSAHVPFQELLDDLAKVIKDYRQIGVEYIAIPYLGEAHRPAGSRYPEALGELRRIGAELKENGFGFLYHNHDFEFVKLQSGVLGLDDIFTQIDGDLLNVELDTCWVEVAGQSAVDYISKYGARCEIVHLKDYVSEGRPKNLSELLTVEREKMAEVEEGFFQFRSVGFGQMLWEPILAAIIEAGSQWVIVEQDEHYGLGALEAARRSREYLKILGW